MNPPRSLRFPLLLFLSLNLLWLIPAAEIAEGKWTNLFDGQSLQGWVPVNEVVFEPKDGNLRLIKGMGWLRTEKQYQDFVVEFEWRALEEQYDSGLFLRAGLDGKPWPKDVWQLNLRYNQIGALVKGFRTVVPAETPKAPINHWVKFRVEVRGKKVKLMVDGEDAWETDKLDAERGYLGFQAENKAFDFRNIRIQEL